MCLIRLGMDLWLLGYPEQAAQKRAAGLALARDLAHPFSLGYALAWDAVVQNHRRDARATREAAEATIAVSREHRLDLWLAIGTVLRGWAIAEQGEIETGIEVMHEGMTAFRATGSRFIRPYFLGLLAEQWGKLGEVERGLTLLAEALAEVERSGECWCEAELHRRQGDVSQLHDAAGSGDGNDAVEVAFQHALAVARHRAAKALELRAAVSLARLWKRQGKRRGAHRLLEELLGWFVEGPDSPEVIAARSLLAQLR